MPIVDDRGRLFGKINLIDLAVLLFLAALIPLAYSAYVLFHTPPPRVLAASPSSVDYLAGAEQHVQLQGEHLRPFLRARLGTLEARTFAVKSPVSAELRFADLLPGTYDVVLLDESQEVARLPGGLTISPPPVRLVGWFVGSTRADEWLAPGLKFGAPDHPVEVLALEQIDESIKRPATLRVACQMSAEKQCIVNGAPVRAGAELKLTAPGRTDPVTFHVEQLRLDASWLTVKVRLMGLPESIARVRPGDIDTHTDAPVVGSPLAGVITGAIVRSVGESLKNQGTYSITAVRPQAPGTDLSAYGVLNAAVPVDAQFAELLVPVDAALVYRGYAIHPGNLLTFDTATYRLQALIIGVSE